MDTKCITFVRACFISFMTLEEETTYPSSGRDTGIIPQISIWLDECVVSGPEVVGIAPASKQLKRHNSLAVLQKCFGRTWSGHKNAQRVHLSFN